MEKGNCPPCENDKHTVDYIVVGVGTSGPLIIRALADAGKTVLGIERGINHTGDPIVEGGLATVFPPAGNATVITYDTRYAVTKFVPDEVNARKLGQLAFAEQYTVGVGGGGSSAHNYLNAVRGTSTFWNTVGLDSGEPKLWSYFPNLERLKAIETFTGVSQKPEERGIKGNIFVTQPAVTLANSPQAPIASALSTVTGSPIVLDYNVSGADLALQINQNTVFPPAGGRSYAINAYLPPDVMKFNGDSTNFSRHPFKVAFETTVVKILFENKRAIGVVYKRKNGEQHVAFAKKKVILCAGCPWSAQLLQLSGIGDAKLLRDLGIERVVDNPNVGKDLQTHYGVTFSITGLLPGGFTAFTGGLPYYSDAGRKFQWAISPFGGLTPNLNAAITRPPGPFFGGSIFNLKPRSRGTAFIVQNSPFIFPNIYYNLYTDGDQTDPLSDLSASVAAYKLARDWARQLGQTMVWPPESHFIPGDDSKLIFDALSQARDALTSHYSNTTAMGTSISDSVVSGKLKVFGVKGLMVADISVFRRVADGNTVLPVYAVGAVATEILGVKVPT